MSKKVRLIIDKSKENKFGVEANRNGSWTLDRRFKTRKRAQDHIDNLYRNSKQDDDFEYEVDNG